MASKSKSIGSCASRKPTTTDDGWLTLNETAHLFGQDRRTIKRRAMAGDFDLRVDGNGHFHISRESINRHMRELEERHARRG